MGLDFLQQANSAFIEEMHERYRRDPATVPEDWRRFFAGDLERALQEREASPAGAGPVAARTRAEPAASGAPAADVEPTIGVFDLIHSYRELGHLIANLDPLGENQSNHPLLELSQFGFSDADLDRVVACPSFGACDHAPLRELIMLLRATYCGTLGVEYMHISSKEQREWLQAQIEPTLNMPQLTGEDRIQVLTAMITTASFEQFLHTKFLGQKRFSLEGADSLVPLLNTLIEEAGNRGVDEIIMGMSHRGRLNVMANVMGKPYHEIFAEFEGSFLPTNIQGDGDVKYHLGYSRDHVSGDGHKIHISLLSNPSHLEAIDPIVEGIVHAKQQYLHDTEHRRVMPLLLHGDAAFTGQGVVMETMSLSELRAYHNGGTVHVIINNQIGFTTSPREARFTRYPSDLARVFNAPVFHVNADDPEAAAQAARLATAFRYEFKEDAIIHLICYRRHGHNEIDDPTFTQPVMYRKIKGKRPAHELYRERLEAEKIITPADAEEIAQSARKRFEEALDYARDTMPRQRIFAFAGAWEGMHWAGKDWTARTQVPARTLRRIAEETSKLPPTFKPHQKIVKLLESRRAMLDGDGAIDWACAEMLAFGTLLTEGFNVRLSGQDSERGTFSQRHATLHDTESNQRIVPLNHVAPRQGHYTPINSMLSEEGVLGFEYGFSSADPRNLVLWEAQYGDFVNNAQVVIDQFIASAESKWQRQSGIVLLLPHGYEGQGPEHSSARLERFLQLCAQDNLQVCYPTTPAQYFHVLRRQQHRRFRKPLVLMTPKSMLRFKLAVSRLAEFSETGFQLVLDDPEPIDRKQVRRVLLCSGKVFYDLLVGRSERVIDNVAIVRIEQLYPFPADEIRGLLASYPSDAEISWVQEESKNCGAWGFLEPRLRTLFGADRPADYVGREASASPATGSYKIHLQELEQILNRALRRPEVKVERKAHAS